MLTSDTDAYYSPADVAQEVAETVGRSRPECVVDSHCGRGALLDAMEGNFPRVKCAGIDLDDRAISHLKKERPHWALVRGDALAKSTWNKLRPTLGKSVDVAVLNPPFSMGQAKGLEITFHDRVLRGSLAMAHVLVTLQHSNPKRIVAILPESWMFSDLDKAGRAILESLYDVRLAGEFKSSTFRGARANSVLVSMVRPKALRVPAWTESSLEKLPTVEVVRGGLPCFEATVVRKGPRFVHSTDIVRLVHGLPVSKLQAVRPFIRGLVQGHLILLPRVGVPKLENIGTICLNETVQLSDCVLALRYECAEEAARACEAIHRHYPSLVQLYRGTGARFVTLERLSAWLHTIRVNEAAF